MAQAETAHRNAWVQYELERNRPQVLRDFRSVERDLLEASRLSERAEQRARKTRGVAERSARAAIEGAHVELRHGLQLARATVLLRAERRRLQEARLALREASVLLGAGHYTEARDRAAAAANGLREATGGAVEKAQRFEDEVTLARWRRALEETRMWSRTTGGAVLLVSKAQNRLELVIGGRTVREYHVDLGANGISDKLRAGDLATPEGRYQIVAKRDRGSSQFHRALVLDYPNQDDRRRFRAARADGSLPPGAEIGGQIEIHGDGGRGRNWTRGCVALSNRDIDDLFPRVGAGTPVTIVGSDGTPGAFSGKPAPMERGER